MPTLIGYHEIKDAQHWLSSPRREELFGPLGITNIRTFVDPQNPTRAAVPTFPPATRSAKSIRKSVTPLSRKNAGNAKISN